MINKKKYLLLLCFFLTLLACSNKKSEIKEIITTGTRINTDIQVNEYFQDDIHYKIFTSWEGGIAIINYTKDSLEISNLNMQ
jgi:hypothetical protein